MLSGGTASGTVVSVGQETIFAGGTDIGAIIELGGLMFVSAGGTAISANVLSGGDWMSVSRAAAKPLIRRCNRARQ